MAIATRDSKLPRPFFGLLHTDEHAVLPATPSATCSRHEVNSRLYIYKLNFGQRGLSQELSRRCFKRKSFCDSDVSSSLDCMIERDYKAKTPARAATKVQATIPAK